MSLDALETLSKFTSPLLIPLPPSPPPRIAIPSRKPAGWISVAPRLGSGRFVSATTSERRSSAGGVSHPQNVVNARGDSGGQADDEARERDGGPGGWGWGSGVGNSRTAYGSIPGPSALLDQRMPSSSFGTAHRSSSLTARPGGMSSTRGKRIISGTMQYALLPPSPSPSPPRDTVLPHPNTHASRPLHAEQTSRSSSRSDRNAAPPSTASPRSESEQIHTPLPGLDLHTPPPHHPNHTTDFDLHTGSHGDEKDTPILHFGAADHDPDTSFRSVSEADSTPDLLEDEEYGEEGEHEWVAGEVLAEREADEEWMEHVRSQLNALFPDFFAHVDSSPRHPDSEFPIESTSPQRFAVRPVGVRAEVEDLRYEIDRLRGVVGELAEGLTVARGNAAATDDRGVTEDAEGRVSKLEPGADDAEVELERMARMNSGDVADRSFARTRAQTKLKPSASADSEEVEVEQMMYVAPEGEVADPTAERLLVKNAQQVTHLLRLLDHRLHPDQTHEKDIQALLSEHNLDEMFSRLSPLVGSYNISS